MESGRPYSTGWKKNVSVVVVVTTVIFFLLYCGYRGSPVGIHLPSTVYESNNRRQHNVAYTSLQFTVSYISVTVYFRTVLHREEEAVHCVSKTTQL